jgi:hypothetical protein
MIEGRLRLVRNYEPLLKGVPWPGGVPRNYQEMFELYGTHIQNEIKKKNKVLTNFADHYQGVCEKLIAAQVLERYVKRVAECSDDPLPDTISGLDASRLLSISFGAWRSRQWSYHKVFCKDMKGRLPAGYEGIQYAHGTIIRNGKAISWVSKMPSPIEIDPVTGEKILVSRGYGREETLYETSDVLEVPLDYFRGAKRNLMAWPARSVQPHQFLAYLLMAVRNHFWNGCRTIMRRAQDRPADCFGVFKTPEGTYDENWTENLSDDRHWADRLEAAIDLRNLDSSKLTPEKQLLLAQFDQ